MAILSKGYLVYNRVAALIMPELSPVRLSYNFCWGGGGRSACRKNFAWHTPLFSHHTLSTKVFLLEPTQEYFLNIIPVGIASVELSFSAMKLDCVVALLMVT